MTEYTYAVEDIKEFGAIAFRSTELYEKEQGTLRKATQRTNFHRVGLSRQLADRVMRYDLCSKMNLQARSSLPWLATPGAVRPIWRVSRRCYLELSRTAIENVGNIRVGPLARFAAAKSLYKAVQEQLDGPDDPVEALRIRNRLSIPPLTEGAVFAEDCTNLVVHHTLSTRTARMMAPQFVLLSTETGDEVVAEFFFVCEVVRKSGQRAFRVCLNLMVEKSAWTGTGRNAVKHNQGLLSEVGLKLYVREGGSSRPKLSFFTLDTIIGRAVLFPKDLEAETPTTFWSNYLMSDIMRPYSYLIKDQYPLAKAADEFPNADQGDEEQLPGARAARAAGRGQQQAGRGRRRGGEDQQVAVEKRRRR